MKRIFLAAAAAVLSCAALQAPAATTFYKLTEPTGRVTYLDRPPAGFDGKVEAVTVDPDANTARLPDSLPAEAPPPSEAERIIRSAEVERLSSQKSAEVNLRRAEDNLARAKQSLLDAQNNSTAEDWFYYTHTNGSARRGPRPEYAARLEALDANIKAAEANLSDAQREYRLSY